ncbi:ABC transporter ATP-binding protein [Deinococcus maricopensis]|uniref:Sulfate-transporting ATPase n=1 Tax=Deinococcus maricopensis (strain DSM 21211 / LMG 22137 / NRRL B-23946 / LB-34) TaxID=709986 RepID=E8U7N3_DEIML|nr:ABC transporter ATP-binding protein [Deinococcus maricopensis]ADV67072.1 Sulfate-transporting ATPase [Deinococcus maricopensis DSM 21211]
MIEVQHYHKQFGRHTAVRDLSFTVRPGELFGLLGPNGAGKTTTIRAIVGLTRPTSGTVRVAGHDVWRDPERAKRSFGYIPDRPYLYGKLTGRELLRFIADLHRLDPAQADRDIERWLDFFALEHFGNELTETYSHGMRQKLTIITALLPEPPVLIVDEPMVGLDPKAAKQVRELFQDYADRGRTVLLTTHSLPLAEAVAGRICVLDRGRVLGLGTLDELRNQTGTHAGGVDGDSLERIFFRLVEEEAAERERARAEADT